MLFFSLDGSLPAYVREELREAEVGITEVKSVDEARKALLGRKHHILVLRSDELCDAQLELLEFVQSHNLTTQVIVAVKRGDVKATIRAMKAGARDLVIATTLGGELSKAVLESLDSMMHSASAGGHDSQNILDTRRNDMEENKRPGSLQQEPQYTKIPIGCTWDEAERIIINETLAFTHNNKSKAARILGLSRKTLHNKLRQVVPMRPQTVGDNS